MGKMKEYYYEQLEKKDSKKVQIYISGECGCIVVKGLEDLCPHCLEEYNDMILVEEQYEREIFESMMELERKKA